MSGARGRTHAPGTPRGGALMPVCVISRDAHASAAADRLCALLAMRPGAVDGVQDGGRCSDCSYRSRSPLFSPTYVAAPVCPRLRARARASWSRKELGIGRARISIAFVRKTALPRILGGRVHARMPVPRMHTRIA